MKADIARILQEEGYLWNYEVVTGTSTKLKLKPKYIDGRPVLTDLKRVSTPGRRKYVGFDEIPPVMSGLGINILSTSKGVMSGGSAKRQKLGGELIASVW
jgi:small subunit ribosomal protein S8